MILYVAVALGGALGAMARYATYRLVESMFGSAFPWATLCVNFFGAFIAAFFLSVLTEKLGGAVFLRLLVFTGFLGAYTTFSAFAVENMILLHHGAIVKFIVNVCLTNIGTITLAIAGNKLARYFF